MMRRLQGGYYTDVRRKCCNTFYGRSCWANLFAYLLEVPLAQRIIRCVIPSVVLVGQICCFFNKKCHLLSGLSAVLFPRSFLLGKSAAFSIRSATCLADYPLCHSPLGKKASL
jgi:hypothetical protein